LPPAPPTPNTVIRGFSSSRSLIIRFSAIAWSACAAVLLWSRPAARHGPRLLQFREILHPTSGTVINKVQSCHQMLRQIGAIRQAIAGTA
jgi:hypothetical protein